MGTPQAQNRGGFAPVRQVAPDQRSLVQISAIGLIQQRRRGPLVVDNDQRLVAIFGMHLWDWRRTLCLVAGLLNVALSIQQYRKAKSALR